MVMQSTFRESWITSVFAAVGDLQGVVDGYFFTGAAMSRRLQTTLLVTMFSPQTKLAELATEGPPGNGV